MIDNINRSKQRPSKNIKESLSTSVERSRSLAIVIKLEWYIVNQVTKVNNRAYVSLITAIFSDLTLNIFVTGHS